MQCWVSQCQVGTCTIPSLVAMPGGRTSSGEELDDCELGELVQDCPDKVDDVLGVPKKVR